MKTLRRRKLLTGFGSLVFAGGFCRGEEEENVEPIPISIPVSPKVRDIMEELMAKNDLTLNKFVQYFGIIVYEGSELSFHEEQPLIVGKLARSQGVMLVHLVSILSQMKTEKAIRHYLQSIFEGGCEFC